MTLAPHVKSRFLSMIKAVIFDCDGTIMNTESGRPSLYPGMLELLQRLAENEFELFIWTGRDAPSLNQFLREFQIGKYFSDIRCAGDCASKPQPDGLVQMLAHLKPHECVVIGDSWADMAGAKTFGAFGIAALWNTQVSRAHLMEAGATTSAVKPPDCYDVILKLGS